MPAAHARDEAIRQARRLGDPAAVCAALAVLGDWEADETRGRALAGRFVEEGLLTADQVHRLVGVEVSTAVAAAAGVREDAGTRACPTEAFAPNSAPVAVLESVEPAAASPLAVRVDGLSPSSLPDPVPQSAEIGAAEAPLPPSVTVGRPSRLPFLAAAILGVAVALAFWLFAGAERPRAEAPHAPVPTASFAAAPLPPPPRPAGPPAWAPRLRLARDGDSPAVHDRLRAIERQIISSADGSGVSFEARRVLARAPRKDRLVRWVELELGRFHAVSDLRLDGVDIAWARE